MSVYKVTSVSFPVLFFGVLGVTPRGHPPGTAGGMSHVAASLLWTSGLWSASLVVVVCGLCCMWEIIQERKKDPNWKGRSKLSLCADGKRVNIQKLKDCPYKVLKLINEFSKVAIYYKISIQKLVAFLYTNMKYQKGNEI